MGLELRGEKLVVLGVRDQAYGGCWRACGSPGHARSVHAHCPPAQAMPTPLPDGNHLPWTSLLPACLCSGAITSTAVTVIPLHSQAIPPQFAASSRVPLPSRYNPNSLMRLLRSLLSRSMTLLHVPSCLFHFQFCMSPARILLHSGQRHSLSLSPPRLCTCSALPATLWATLLLLELPPLLRWLPLLPQASPHLSPGPSLAQPPTLSLGKCAP